MDVFVDRENALNAAWVTCAGNVGEQAPCHRMVIYSRPSGNPKSGNDPLITREGLPYNNKAYLQD